MGLGNALKELFPDERSTIISVEANACNGMLLRTAAGKVERLSTKQLWVQGAIQSNGMEAQEAPRAENASGISAHPMGGVRIEGGPPWMEYHTPGGCLGHPTPKR